MFTDHNQRGISLIELVMFIVIVGIALAGIMLVMNQTSGHSADTLVRKQALTVAESMLEEIESHDFVAVFAVSPVTQANRASAYHIANDYNGFATSGVFPIDGTSTVVPGLGDYSVAVAVTSSVLGGISAASAVQITVTVTPPAGKAVVATGYRTAY